MQVNSISSTGFGVSMSKGLGEELFLEANQRGSKSLNAYIKQTKKLESWGEETSYIVKETSRDRFGLKSALFLVNNYLAPLRKAKLTDKEPLLDSFMELKKSDIVNAEKKFRI